MAHTRTHWWGDPSWGFWFLLRCMVFAIFDWGVAIHQVLASIILAQVTFRTWPHTKETVNLSDWGYHKSTKMPCWNTWDDSVLGIHSLLLSLCLLFRWMHVYTNSPILGLVCLRIGLTSLEVHKAFPNRQLNLHLPLSCQVAKMILN